MGTLSQNPYNIYHVQKGKTNPRDPWCPEKRSGGMSRAGAAYDATIGRALRGVRREAADLIRERDLFPVLDLCCGTGAQLRLLPGGVRVGLDLDGNMLRHAQKHGPEALFLRADAGRIPLRSGSFICVLVAYALHEKTADMRRRMLGEVRRILKPGGSLLLIDFDPPWNPASRLGRLFTFSIERFAGKEHFENGQAFLRQGGLTGFASSLDLKVMDNRPIPLGNSRMLLARFPPG
jgi:SAM-dependent methyltransferase